MHTPGFFITAEIVRADEAMPMGLEGFIQGKLAQINQGISARRFAFCEGNWRMFLTFFPTTEVVDERYALKNKVISRGYK